MRGAWRVGMNSVFFGLKRAYYATVYPTRAPLAPIGMSMARYDMLTAIGRYPKILQSKLRTVLGVVAATICKMLKALEKLGYVSRSVDKDKRQRVVEITERGRLALFTSDGLMDNHPDGFMQGTPFLDIPGADRRFYELFYWDVNFIGYYEESLRMEKDLGMAFGPYRMWHPDD